MDITRTLKTGLAAAGLTIALLGCGPEPTIKLETEKDPEINGGSGYIVTRVAVFNDELAYEGKRGIYEIVDIKTGKKYVGVSGIGITELGEHPSGKNNVEDER